MPYYAAVARTQGREPDLADRKNCRLLFTTLKRELALFTPDPPSKNRIVAWVFMPNHIHAILESTHEKTANQLWRAPLMRMSAISWETIPDLIPIADQQKLNRQIRYIHLNPCRANLCDDPLSWEWSSYREIMSATVVRLSSSKAWSQLEGIVSLERLHRYTSSDPACDVNGTPAPISKPFGSFHASVDQWMRAVLIASRGLPEDLKVRSSFRRRLLCAALRKDGALRTQIVADRLGCSLRTAQRIFQKIPSGKQITGRDLAVLQRILDEPRFNLSENLPAPLPSLSRVSFKRHSGVSQSSLGP